ncbi:MAG: HD domain-containing protein [Anaerolineales bacterium]|nr:HD domain-containing protein [Anaerolineales bacterium]
MNLIINSSITGLAFLLYSGLYVIVTISKSQTDLRRVFRWYLLIMSLWSLAAFLIYVDEPRSEFWFRMMVSIQPGMMISIFAFARTNINVRNIWDTVVVLFGIGIIALSLIPNLLVSNFHLESGIIISDLTPYTYIPAIPGFILIFYSIATLIGSYRRSNDPIQQNRLLYLILGIGVMILGNTLNFTPLRKYPIDIAANAITAIIIVYAILRYQLLDIRVVIRQGMVYSIPTIIIGTIYFLIITLSLNIFHIYSGGEIFLLSLVVAVVTAMVAEPLRLRAQKIIDRMFFREKYDSQVMLQTLSSRAASVLDLYQITNMILEKVTSTLHIPKAAFFLRDEETGIFQITTQIGLEDVGHLTFRQGHPLVLRLSTHDNVVGRQDMEVLPQFQSLWRSERQDLEEMGAELFIPIKVGSQLVGIFTFGPKLSEQTYSMEEQLTLSTLANQTAVAIENARLFTSEQNRRKEIDTLYNLSHQLVATDELDTVLQSIAQHAAESIHVPYSRIVTIEANGDYYCRAIYPERNLSGPLSLGKIEPHVAEHYYNQVLLSGEPVVIDINKPDWQEEEKQALFKNHANKLCLCPLIGVDEQIGLLILGEFHGSQAAPFTATELRLVKAIADYGTSAIQRAVLHEQLEANFLQTVVSLANAIDARDSYTGNHSQRMADMAGLVCRKMGISDVDIEAIHWAAILHDIGKIGVPDHILNKKGPLTKKEWVVMKEHPVIGAKIVAPVKYLASVAPIIQSHHEKFDGSGYPIGLEGEDIPLLSRILTVVDAYVAIRDERVYSKSHTHKQAVAELRRSSGTHFDPQVVDIFCQTIKK